MKRFLTLRDKPELKEEAAEWFSSKWSVPLCRKQVTSKKYGKSQILSELWNAAD